MMQRERSDVYIIPPNFAKEGTLFSGRIEGRNAFEAAVLFIVLFRILFFIDVSIKLRIYIGIIVILPLTILAVVGVNGESLLSFIIQFMQRAEEKLEIPTYTNCTICFVHVYDETLPLARVRDHDNYEEKHVQDIITNFFLRSDSGLYTNTCHVTRMGEEDRTLLYVMDSSKFPAWISDFGKETGIEKNHE